MSTAQSESEYNVLNEIKLYVLISFASATDVKLFEEVLSKKDLVRPNNNISVAPFTFESTLNNAEQERRRFAF